jgi:branched-chain amino acid transport system permease protein
MLSAAIAAVAGVLFAINFKLAPDLWFQGLKSFPAVILGGLDSVIGASLAGLIIGVIENLAQGYLGEGLREIAGFVVIIVVLMVRPYGLFGSADIERV